MYWVVVFLGSCSGYALPRFPLFIGWSRIPTTSTTYIIYSLSCLHNIRTNTEVIHCFTVAIYLVRMRKRYCLRALPTFYCTSRPLRDAAVAGPEMVAMIGDAAPRLCSTSRHHAAIVRVTRWTTELNDAFLHTRSQIPSMKMSPGCEHSIQRIASKVRICGPGS